MFPSGSDQPRPAARSLWAVLRDATDVAIAFVTLESYGLDDLCPGRRARVDQGFVSEQGLVCELGFVSGHIAPLAVADEPFARDTEATAAALAAGRSPFLAFPTTVAASVRSAPHPHRAELRTLTRARRPGAAAFQEQLCLTPLRARTPHDHAFPAPPPRRRTAPQDTPH